MGAHRFDVRSADGTPLAVWADGQGPSLVLVHGSMCDHTASDPLVAELRDTMTTFAMDRRGFGASGDAAGYALGGAALTGAVHHLVLYEPGLGIPYPAGSIEAVEAALAAGDREAALLLVLVGIIGMRDEEIASAPTLLLAGAESHPVLKEATGRALAAIPGARVEVLDGHAHLAHRSDPAMVAAVVQEFVSGPACPGCGRPRRS
jgi:pimeloyl-ACP methyl ester carboxylesterase